MEEGGLEITKYVIFISSTQQSDFNHIKLQSYILI